MVSNISVRMMYYTLSCKLERLRKVIALSPYLLGCNGLAYLVTWLFFNCFSVTKHPCNLCVFILGVNAAGHGSSIVRLADEPSDDFSRLEIFINDMWVAVCDEGMMFMEAAADSVCQELDGVGAESSNYT